MTTLLYIIWFGIPALFLLLALWAKLEELSGKSKKENPGDFFKQGLFVLACAFATLLLDIYALPGIAENMMPSWIPLLFLRIILFPLVLYVGALAVGPTKQIRIERASRPTEKHRRR